MPFAQGPLEVVSVDLARQIAHSRAISRFVERAWRQGGGGGRCEEDVLLGVWVAHLRAKQISSGEINYLSVDLNECVRLITRFC